MALAQTICATSPALTSLFDGDFTESEDSEPSVSPELDHQEASLLRTALTQKRLFAFERMFPISAHLASSNPSFGVFDSDIKVAQTLVCKYQSKTSVLSGKLILVSIQLAKNTRTIWSRY